MPRQKDGSVAFAHSGIGVSGIGVRVQFSGIGKIGVRGKIGNRVRGKIGVRVHHPKAISNLNMPSSRVGH
jgi:hypothetical protein